MVPKTGIPLVDFVLLLLVEHGYLLTAAATLLENLPVVGSFVPGETVVMAAGFVAIGEALQPGWVFAAALVGSLVGSNVGYFAGRRGGRPMVEQHGHRFYISEQRLAAAEGFFERHGPNTILFARFAPGVKNLAPLIAGISRMNVLVFEAYTFLSAAAYAALMVSLGYFFGSNFQLLLKMVQRAGYVGLLIIAIIVGLALWERRRIIRRRISRYALLADQPALPKPEDVRDVD